MKAFTNSEVLTLNALDTLSKQNIDTRLDPHTFRLINYIVHNVCRQLEESEELAKHNIKIND